MKKLIAFLGLGQYQSTRYYLGDQEWASSFSPPAVAHFVRPDIVLICATPQVRAGPHLPALQRELEQAGLASQIIEIPDGKDETELWQIFDAMTEAVEAGDTVIFDITHSFRSLPLLAFLAVAYLKAARGVTTEKLLYGAYEARDQASNRTPIFDLTPFVDLLEWLTAAERFVEVGDGRRLSELLQWGIPTGPELAQHSQARQLRDRLKPAATIVEDISLALRLIRPLETAQAAAKLQEALENAGPVIQQRARPFALLADQVAQAYSPFALDEEAAISWPGLKVQYQMIDWYLKKDQLVQAVALAREWIVTALLLRFGGQMLEPKHRAEAEWVLNSAARKRGDVPQTPTELGVTLEALPYAPHLVGLWSKLGQLRNDIAHAGMRQAYGQSKGLSRQIGRAWEQLQSLAPDLLSPTGGSAASREGEP
jgi:CRISPR-associated DxTHG motif protein